MERFTQLCKLQRIDSEIEYAYDSEGNRVKKYYSDMNTTKYYVRDAAGNVIAAYDENGSQQYVNLFGADVFGKYSRNDGNYFYYVKDHLGSTRTVVNSSGDVAEAYEYYPFGKIARSYLTGSGTDEKFTGKELDNDAGERVYCFGARNYDGDVIRWWSVDPMRHLRPGLSPYNYVQNNPINRFDPNGMLDEDKEKDDLLKKVLTFISNITGLNDRDKNIYEKSSNENSIANSDEIQGIKKVAEAGEKAKEKVVEGIDEIHDVSSTTSGAAGIGALSTTGTPLSPALTATSSASGFVAAGASGLNWLITGDPKYRDNFLFEMGTIGIGAGANTIKAGKTLTPENVDILQDVYKNFVSGSSWGISLKK